MSPEASDQGGNPSPTPPSQAERCCGSPCVQNLGHLPPGIGWPTIRVIGETPNTKIRNGDKMTMAGRKPADRPTVTRHKPTHDWTEVANVPYDGPRPELPLSRTILKGDEPLEVPIENRTRDWWTALCKMPHCVLWQDSDWAFALDTAMVHAAASHGQVTAMAELRMREKVLGTTLDARRDLRIRYVEPELLTPVIAPVSSIDERRQKLLDA